jgi:hypothetical protein
MGSEMISLLAMAKLANKDNLLDGIETIRDDTQKSATWLIIFLTGYIRIMNKRYMYPVRREQVENITVEEEPSISRYMIPFFGPANYG